MEAGVPMPTVIFALDMLSLEMKSKMLADAVQRQAQEAPPNGETKSPLIIPPPTFEDRKHD